MVKQYKFARFVDPVSGQKLKHVYKLGKGYDLEFTKINAPDKSYIAIDLIKTFRKMVFGKRRICKTKTFKYLLGSTMDTRQMYMFLDR